jgi:small subunit ribosomal protein S1
MLSKGGFVMMETHSDIEAGSRRPARNDKGPHLDAHGKTEAKGKGVGEDRDFQTLYEESLHDIREGNIVSGEVLKIEKDTVFVDFGYKSEGEIPLSEFQDSDGNVTIAEGDRVDVVLVRKADEKGYPVLSRKGIEDVKRRQVIEEAFSEGKPVRGKIISQVKGGYIVDIGIRAFLPGSHVDLYPTAEPSSWIGTEHEFKVISYDRRQGNVVLSRKALLEEQKEDQRQETLDQIREGAVLQGRIRRVMDYGLLVDLGAVFGLVHITNLSWGKTRDISKSFHVGNDVTVKVLDYTPDKKRVSLGMKQLLPDPWPDIEKKYPVGTKIEASVVALKKYGAFVEIEEGIEGLIPTSELSWIRKIVHPSQVLNLGDMVETVVTSVDSEKRQISLSKKDAESNPWDRIEKKYPIGTVIEGKIMKVMDFGIFIGIQEGIDGLVHQSDMTWSDSPPDPHELYEVGQTVQAVVLSIDNEKQHFSLGVKHLIPKA